MLSSDMLTFCAYPRDMGSLHLWTLGTCDDIRFVESTGVLPTILSIQPAFSLLLRMPGAKSTRKPTIFKLHDLGQILSLCALISNNTISNFGTTPEETAMSLTRRDLFDATITGTRFLECYFVKVCNRCELSLQS